MGELVFILCNTWKACAIKTAQGGLSLSARRHRRSLHVRHRGLASDSTSEEFQNLGMSCLLVHVSTPNAMQWCRKGMAGMAVTAPLRPSAMYCIRRKRSIPLPQRGHLIAVQVMELSSSRRDVSML